LGFVIVGHLYTIDYIMSFVRVGRLLPLFAQRGARLASVQTTRGYAEMAFTFASSSNVRSWPWPMVSGCWLL